MNTLDQIDNVALFEEIGRRLAHLRITAGLQQADLAERAGISRDALSRMENGVGGARLESFLSVLRVLGVLNALSVVLPEPTLTPLQMWDREKRKVKFPKRVRVKKPPRVIKWGDEDA